MSRVLLGGFFLVAVATSSNSTSSKFFVVGCVSLLRDAMQKKLVYPP